MASSPCGRYIAAEAGADIVVAKIINGEIVQRMQAHTKAVTCISFAAPSKKLSLGHWTRTLLCGNGKYQNRLCKFLKGTAKLVGIAVSNGGGRIFCWSYDRTLRIWDASAGAQTEKLAQGSEVTCVAVYSETSMIALGFHVGTLRVLDCVTKDVLFEDAGVHTGRIYNVSFSSNGSYVATTESSDRKICMWNTRTWTRVAHSFEEHEVG